MLTLPPELAASVDVVAAVSFDADGQVVAVSGLDAIADGARLDLSIESGEPAFAVDLIGWRSADLPGFGAADAEAARSTPLRVARECEAPLPRPRATRRLHGDGAPAADALAFLSPAIVSAPCLPGWSDTLSVELRCLTSFCEPSITEEEDCSATVDFQSCDQGRFTVRPTLGAPCASSVENRCGGAQPIASGGAELTCEIAMGQCDLRFYTTDDPGWATVTRATVLDVRAMPPGDVDQLSLRTWHRATGYLGSIFAMGDRLGVVSFGGQFRTRVDCAKDSDDQVVWLNRGLETVATTTVPPCTSKILATADGTRAHGIAWQTTVTGTTGRVRDLEVFELDGTGRITRRAPIDLTGLDLCRVGQAILTPDERTMILGTCTNPPAGRTFASGTHLFVDLESYAVERVPTVDNDVYGMTFEGETLVFSGEQDDVVTWMDVRTKAVRAEAQIPTAVSISVGDVISDEASDRTFLAVPSDDATIGVFERRRYAARTSVYQGDWLPLSFARVGPGLGELVVAASRPGRGATPWAASLARLSIEDDGVKPGVVELGFGVMGQHVRTADGVLWATLPWSGEVVRVSLAER